MGLSFLLPLGLGALAALLIPLLLHLHRRQEQQATFFAALRWIRGPARPRRRVRLEQWSLLLLRLLLLVVLALLLAQPLWRGAAADAREWVVVAPGVDAAQARARLNLPGAQWRWLLPGFPPLDNATPGPDDARDSASLLRELDSELAAGANLHVIVPDTVRGMDGGEIVLTRTVDWLIDEQAPGAPPAPPKASPQRISLRGADAAARPYLQSAVAAWNAVDADRFTLVSEASDAPLDSTTSLVFWLDAEPSPQLLQWVEAGGSALLDSPKLSPADTVTHDAAGAALLRAKPQGRGRLLSFTAPLQPQQLPLLLDATFPQVLRDALLPVPFTPDRAAAVGMQPRSGAAPSTAAALPLSPSLLLLAALAFLAERLLSFHYARRRS